MIGRSKSRDFNLFSFVSDHTFRMGRMVRMEAGRDRADDKGPKELKYGKLTYANTSPFIGIMIPGLTMQA